MDGTAMIEIKVEDNLADFNRRLTQLEKKEMPYATAVALTRTVQDAQSAIISAIPHIFKTTKKWWLKQQPTGIKITPAKKIRLLASVYTSAFFAALQEAGGVKTPHRGKNLAVPSDKVPKSRRKSGGARKTLDMKRTFATKRGIYRKKGGKKKPIIEKQYTFSRTAIIPKRFGFKRIAAKVTARRFKQHLERELGKAVEKTRKRVD